MNCPRCGSKNIEVLPTEVPEGKEDYEQYYCNDCMLNWDSEDDFDRYPY